MFARIGAIGARTFAGLVPLLSGAEQEELFEAVVGETASLQSPLRG